MLNTTRATDIAKVVTALDPVAQDTLMKYLYKGMASVEDGGNCSVLLNWHEKVRTARDTRVPPQSPAGNAALAGQLLTPRRDFCPVLGPPAAHGSRRRRVHCADNVGPPSDLSVARAGTKPLRAQQGFLGVTERARIQYVYIACTSADGHVVTSAIPEVQPQRVRHHQGRCLSFLHNLGA